MLKIDETQVPAGMPRFYFHISNDAETLRDEKGIILDDTVAAVAYARRIVREIAQTEMVTVHITDADGRALMQVP
jgi:hypothetical protein